MVFTCKTFKKNRRPRMTRRLWPKSSKGRKGRRFFTRKQRKQTGGNLYRELPKHAKGAVDVEPLDWQA
jgi:hypothetical protein